MGINSHKSRFFVDNLQINRLKRPLLEACEPPEHLDPLRAGEEAITASKQTINL